jgi:hypothetical protein
MLGLDRTRIVYWAPSGAGMGAAMAAIKSGACAVLVNAFTDGVRMGVHPSAAAVAQAFGASSFDEISARFPLRTRVPDALRAARALGLRPRLLLVQNELDRTFYERQYRPLCEAFDVPLEGGLDPTGTILSVPYSDPAGHGPESWELRARLITHDLPRLLGPPPVATSEPFGCEAHLLSAGSLGVRIPAGASIVRLRSVPVRIPQDPRVLGARLGGLRIDDEVVSLDDPALVRGFHPVESDGALAWRWTDAEAVLWIAPRAVERSLTLDVLAVATEFA